MRRTTLMIDDGLVREAREVLGTRGIKDTIDKALHEVIAREAGRRLIERFQAMDGMDLDDPDVMRRAWRE